MEKNEAFRNQVLSQLYGLPDPAEPPKEKPSEDVKSEDTKDAEKEEDKTEEKPVKKENEETETVVKEEKLVKNEREADKPPDPDRTEDEKETCKESEATQDKDPLKDTIKSEHSNNNDETTSIADENKDNSNCDSKDRSSNENDDSNTNKNSDSKSFPTHTTPTTTTSHLYSVLMAPLDGRSPYRDHGLRSASENDADSSPRKRMRLENSTPEKMKPERTSESVNQPDSKTTTNNNTSVGMDLTKNQKRKLKKKKRKHLLNRIEVQRAKDFIYSSENEQYSVEKLRTMIEDMTEFLDAIWDVYCSEARVKGESVKEDGYKAAAVLKCLSSSGEGSWGDLQLLSRAKSVLVLRSKNLAASTIARVENELGYDADVRNFIVRMLKFWMEQIVNKG